MVLTDWKREWPRVISGMGRKGDDVIGEERVLAGDGAPGAQRVAIDSEQRGKGDSGSGEESQGKLAKFPIARQKGKPEHGIRLDAGGDAKGHGRSAVVPVRKEGRSERDSDPQQAFDVAAHDAGSVPQPKRLVAKMVAPIYQR